MVTAVLAGSVVVLSGGNRGYLTLVVYLLRQAGLWCLTGVDSQWDEWEDAVCCQSIGLFTHLVAGRQLLSNRVSTYA
jgi:hypothetical protein